MNLISLLKMVFPAAHDLPSHTSGVAQGNSTGNYQKQSGHLPDGKSTAARSTGINPANHEPLLPQMPNISPP